MRNEVFFTVKEITGPLHEYIVMYFLLQLVYRRAACVEEFWDIITTAHVENGHIGVVHTFNAVSLETLEEALVMVIVIPL